jgi:glycerophosphoryl diester phosphodiesterase
MELHNATGGLRMIVIAHRGASAYAPENTEAAFDLGIAMGADAIETDLRATRDGVIVLLHDARVDRTTDGSGLLNELSWAAVQSLDAGSRKHARFFGQRIPTLASFLDRYGRICPLYLEIKAPGIEEAALALVRERNLLDRVVFTSFNLEWVAKVASLAPVRTCWLVNDWTEAESSLAKTGGLYEVSINIRRVDSDLVEKVRSAGLGVRAWGLKDDDLMRQAVAAGVDGVTIDFPDRLIRLLRPAPHGANVS